MDGEFNKFVFQILKKKNMFGDMMGLMGKLKEAKVKAEQTKERLKNVLIDEQSNDGLLSTRVTAHGRLKEVQIDATLLEDKEQLEDYLVAP